MLVKKQFNFYKQHRRNYIKTQILLGLVPILLAIVVDAMFFIYLDVFGHHNVDLVTGIFWLGLYFAWLFYILYKAASPQRDKLDQFLAQVKAVDITGDYKDKNNKTINELVDQLIIAYNMHKPRIYSIDITSEPNAFVYTTNIQNYLIITKSLSNILNKNELACVLAHELAHLAAGDNQVVMISNELEEGLKLFSSLELGCLLESFRYLFNNFLIAILLLIPATVFIIPSSLGFLASYLVQRLVARTREYDADAVAANITGSPGLMATALNKMADYANDPRIKLAISAEKRKDADESSSDDKKKEEVKKHEDDLNYLAKHYPGLFSRDNKLSLLPKSYASLYFYDYRHKFFATHPGAKARIKRLDRLAGNHTIDLQNK